MFIFINAILAAVFLLAPNPPVQTATRIQTDSKLPDTSNTPNLSDFRNIYTPSTISGDGWSISEINFDFTTGWEWIDKPRQCSFVISAYSPEPGTENFPVIKAEYYTPVFGNEYWTYRYENYWEGNWFDIILEGPPIEGAQGEEPFIQWRIDISHQWLYPPFVKGHWTHWETFAFCEDEPIGDPSFNWDMFVIKRDDAGNRHWYYQHLPMVE